MSSLRFLVCLSVLCAALLIPTTYYNRLSAEVHVALFIFGDSHFDAGNNNYIITAPNLRANFWPYGQNFFDSPTGRFSDGRIIPDFIAEYAELPLILPYLQPGFHNYSNGVNFASAGAGALAETHQGLVIDLKSQLSNFKKVKKMLKQKLGDAKAKALVSKAVYLFSIGNNDYTAPFTTNSSLLLSYTHKEYVDMVISSITTVIKKIYKKGGRKFGFVSLGPLGCIPSTKLLSSGSTDACMDEITALAELHNQQLSQVLQKLRSHLKGFKYSFSNFHTFITERMKEPSKYGFKDGERACCGSGVHRGMSSCGGKREVKEYELCENATEFLFFDSDHPSEFAYQQFAELFWSGPPNVTGPYNLQALFEIGRT